MIINNGIIITEKGIINVPNIPINIPFLPGNLNLASEYAAMEWNNNARTVTVDAIRNEFPR